MYAEFLEATEDHEPAVRALFVSLNLTPPDSLWERALSPSRPLPSKPYIIALQEEILAFAMVRPGNLFWAGEYVSSQVVWSYLLADREEADHANQLMLEKLGALADFSLGGGWSVEGTLALRRAGWRHLGNFPRWRLSPGKGKSLSAEPPDPAALQKSMEEAGRIFLHRPEGEDVALRTGRSSLDLALGGGFASFQEITGIKGRELMLTDFRGVLNEDQQQQAAGELTALAKREKAPIYASFLEHNLAQVFEAAGAEFLRPRWGLFSFLGNSDYQNQFIALSPDSPYHFFPADFELDIP